jgi:hypothetical protein
MEEDCTRAEPHVSGVPVALYSGRSQDAVKLRLVKPATTSATLVYVDGVYWLCQSAFTLEWSIPGDYVPYDDVPVQTLLTVGLESPKNLNPFPPCYKTYDTVNVTLVLEDAGAVPEDPEPDDQETSGPRATLWVEDTTIFRSEVENDTGADLRWNIYYQGESRLQTGARGVLSFNLVELGAPLGEYEVVLEISVADRYEPISNRVTTVVRREDLPSATLSVEGTTVTRSEIENDPGSVPLAWSVYHGDELYADIGARDTESIDLSQYPPGEYLVVLQIDLSEASVPERNRVPISNVVGVSTIEDPCDRVKALYDAQNREDIAAELELLYRPDWSAEKTAKWLESREWYAAHYDVEVSDLECTRIWPSADEPGVVYVTHQYKLQFLGSDGNPSYPVRIARVVMVDDQWLIADPDAPAFAGAPPTPKPISPKDGTVFHGGDQVQLRWSEIGISEDTPTLPYAEGYPPNQENLSYGDYRVVIWARADDSENWEIVWDNPVYDTVLALVLGGAGDEHLPMPHPVSEYSWQVQYSNSLFETPESDWSEWSSFRTEMTTPD